MKEQIISLIGEVESTEDLITIRKALRNRYSAIRKEETKFSNFINRNRKPLKQLFIMIMVILGFALYTFVAKTNGADFFSVPSLAADVARDSFSVANSYLEFAAPFLFLIAGMIFGASILGQTLNLIKEIE